MKNEVIGFTGLPGSGKSVAIAGIKDLGVSISMGDVIRNETKKRNLNPTDENLGRIARNLSKWKIASPRPAQLIGSNSRVLQGIGTSQKVVPLG